MTSSSSTPSFPPGLVMPAEWEPHEATWMAFPPAVYDASVSLAGAREAWANVARAIVPFEKVRLLVRPEDRDAAHALLGTAVTYVEVALDDAWARDIAPSFVRSPNGGLFAVDWIFNGWGAQSWARWENDDKVAARVAQVANVPSGRSELVNEGGGIEVNGQGVVLATTSVQLDHARNPGRDARWVDERLGEALGATRVIWLPRGLHGDYREFGTRGHVDLVAKFVSPTTALVHHQANRDHPDFAVSHEVTTILENAGIEVVAVEAPETVVVDGRECDWSYINCYVANDVVVLGVYGASSDEAAAATLRTLFPTRQVVTVDARPLFALGGGVHCITQQQPSEEGRCAK